MLQQPLFEIISLNKGTESIAATVALNAKHPIFDGHFPGTPVLPGVCQIEMLKEILEKTLNQKLLLPEVGSVKFLNVIEPQKTPQLQVEIVAKTSADSFIEATATIADAERFFLKFKGKFFATNEH